MVLCKYVAASPLAQNFYLKSHFISLDFCFPTVHLTNFPQSTVPLRRILAHICQIKCNLISFDAENNKRPSTNVPTGMSGIFIPCGHLDPGPSYLQGFSLVGILKGE